MLNVYQDDTGILNLIAPSGGVVAGIPIMCGSLCVIPTNSAAQGELFAGQTRGVFKLKKNTSTAATVGLAMDWDVSAGEVIAVGSVTGDFVVGHAVQAQASGDAYVYICKSLAAPVVH